MILKTRYIGTRIYIFLTVVDKFASLDRTPNTDDALPYKQLEEILMDGARSKINAMVSFAVEIILISEAILSLI